MANVLLIWVATSRMKWDTLSLTFVREKETTKINLNTTIRVKHAHRISKKKSSQDLRREIQNLVLVVIAKLCKKICTKVVFS
jgi:type II secretory pathway component PulK